MKQNFTPGPWTKSGGRSLDIVDHHADVSIAKIMSPASTMGPKSKAECVANASLVAAAPEMLTALEQALNALEQNHHLVTNKEVRLGFINAQSVIVKALAKARGE